MPSTNFIRGSQTATLNGNAEITSGWTGIGLGYLLDGGGDSTTTIHTVNGNNQYWGITGFDFDLPPSVIITKIRIRIKGYRETAGTTLKFKARLSTSSTYSGGTYSGTFPGNTTSTPSIITYDLSSVGGATLGLSDLTGDNINDLVINISTGTAGGNHYFYGGDVEGEESIGISVDYTFKKPAIPNPRFNSVRYTPYESLLVQEKPNNPNTSGLGDMAFIIDNSTSINENEYGDMWAGIKYMIQVFNDEGFFNGSEPPLKIALYSFGYCHQGTELQNLTGSYDALIDTINFYSDPENRAPSGSTQPSLMFHAAYQELVNDSEARDAAQKIMLYISDGGISNTGSCIIHNSFTEERDVVVALTDDMKAGTYSGYDAIPDGFFDEYVIDIYAIGIGGYPDDQAVLSPNTTLDYAPVNLCSDPSYYYQANDFNSLVNPVVFNFVGTIQSALNQVSKTPPLSVGQQENYTLGSNTGQIDPISPYLKYDGKGPYTPNIIPFQYQWDATNPSGLYTIFTIKLPFEDGRSLPINSIHFTYFYAGLDSTDSYAAIFEHLIFLKPTFNNNSTHHTVRWELTTAPNPEYEGGELVSVGNPTNSYLKHVTSGFALAPGLNPYGIPNYYKNFRYSIKEISVDPSNFPFNDYISNIDVLNVQAVFDSNLSGNGALIKGVAKLI